MTPKERRQQKLIDEYRRNTGRDPVTRFPNDPDWEYEGSKKDREALEQRISMIEDERALRGQEVLFFDEA